ncbi:MAG: ROK family protein [Cellulomonadaceae bacterium]|nr:ROK family protein [Cellulomonadaceae bacterium]
MSGNIPSESQLSVGVEVGPTSTLVALVDATANVIAQEAIPRDAVAKKNIAAALHLVRRLCAEAGITVPDLKAIGICHPGVVSSHNGTISFASSLGIGGTPYPLGAVVEAQTGVPTVVDNVATASALGVAHHNTFHEFHVSREFAVNYEPEWKNQRADFAYLSLGFSLAVGLVLNGYVRRGTVVEGEIGHIPIQPGGLPCHCGQRGCLERYASRSAISRLWPAGGEGDDAITTMFDAAASGNAAALAASSEFADAVATAIRIVILSSGVHGVAIGGPLASAGEPLIAAVRAALDRHATHSPFIEGLGLPSRVDLAPPDVPVGAIGAAALASGDYASPLMVPQVYTIRDTP